jgi:hypothetical protein
MDASWCQIAVKGADPETTRAKSVIADCDEWQKIECEFQRKKTVRQ